jgi:anti-sigma-K factor RskA
VTRYNDAVFSAFAGLDPSVNELRTDNIDQLRDSAEPNTELCIAHIVAVPRRDPKSDRHPRREARRSVPHGRRHSRCGVLGVAVSAALAVAATLLWVSPSAGAPSPHAISASVNVYRAHFSTSTSHRGTVLADREPVRKTPTGSLVK